MRTTLARTTLAVGVASWAGCVAAADQFVSIAGDSVRLRTAPNTTSEVVATLAAGAVFKVGEKKGEWVAVVAPSGEYRHVHQSMVTTSTPPAKLPAAKAGNAAMCKEIVAAERRATQEATAKAGNDFMRAIDIERVLVDRAKLAIYARHGVAPAHSTQITAACAPFAR